MKQILTILALSLCFTLSGQIRADQLPVLDSLSNSDPLITIRGGSFMRFPLSTLSDFLGSAQLDTMYLSGSTLYAITTTPDTITVNLAGISADSTLFVTLTRLTDSLSNYLKTEVDGSVTNEIQTLSFSNPNLSISGGNSVNLSALSGGGGGSVSDYKISVVSDSTSRQTMHPAGVRVLISLINQSNGQGDADTIDASAAGAPLYGNQETVYIHNYIEDEWQILQKGNDYNNAGKVGMEFALINRWAAKYPNDKLYYIKNARSGSSSTVWLPGGESQVLLENWMVIPFINKLIDQGKIPYVSGITIQGEADTGNSIATNQARYEETINYWRQYFPNMPVYIYGVKSDNANVVTAYQNIANSDKLVEYISTADLPTDDGTHYTFEGLDSMAVRFLNAADILGVGTPVVNRVKRGNPTTSTREGYLEYDFSPPDSLEAFIGLWENRYPVRDSFDGDWNLTMGNLGVYQWEQKNTPFNAVLWLKEVPIHEDIKIEWSRRVPAAIFSGPILRASDTGSGLNGYVVQFNTNTMRVLVYKNNSLQHAGTFFPYTQKIDQKAFFRAAVQGHTITVDTSSTGENWGVLFSYDVPEAHQIASGHLVWYSSSNNWYIDDLKIRWSEIDPDFYPFAKTISPGLLGDPTAPTPSAGDDDTSIATTEFVQGEIGQIRATATLDFPSTNTGNVSILTTTVTGASVGDLVQVVPLSNTPAEQGTWSGFVRAANTVSVKFHNDAVNNYDPPSISYNIIVTKF